MGAVFPEVDALPGPEDQGVIANGDGEVDAGECGPDMSRHVVVAFAGVTEEGIAIGGQAGEEAFEVAPNLGVGVFLNQE